MVRVGDTPELNILLLSRDYRRASAWTLEHFCDEISRQHITLRNYGPPEISRVDMLVGSADFFDIVLASHLQFTKCWTGLDRVNIPTACVVNDYFPRHYDYKDNIVKNHQFDLLLFSQQADVGVALSRQRVGSLPAHTRFEWLPFSVDERIYWRDADAARTIDVTAIMSNHVDPNGYPNRPAVFAALSDMAQSYPNLRTCLKLVDNPNGLEYSGGGIYHEAYVNVLQDSKLVIGSLDPHGSTNIRNFEACAAGALLLTDGPPEDFEALGWVEGENYVGYRDVGELVEKVEYWTSPENNEERRRIARAGQALVMERHTNRVRVGEMTDKLKGLIERRAH